MTEHSGTVGLTLNGCRASGSWFCNDSMWSAHVCMQRSTNFLSVWSHANPQWESLSQSVPPFHLSIPVPLFSFVKTKASIMPESRRCCREVFFCRELYSLVYITQAKPGVNLEHVHGSLMLFLYYWLILNPFLCCHVQQPGSTCQYPLKKKKHHVKKLI